MVWIWPGTITLTENYRAWAEFNQEHVLRRLFVWIQCIATNKTVVQLQVVFFFLLLLLDGLSGDQKVQHLPVFYIICRVYSCTKQQQTDCIDFSVYYLIIVDLLVGWFQSSKQRQNQQNTLLWIQQETWNHSPALSRKQCLQRLFSSLTQSIVRCLSRTDFQFCSNLDNTKCREGPIKFLQIQGVHLGKRKGPHFSCMYIDLNKILKKNIYICNYSQWNFLAEI